ncbi:acyltransferase [Pseudomonadota bacterium]
MNLDYLLQRLLGRATCSLGSGAKLHSKARIRNALGKSEHIRIGPHSFIQGELLLFAHGGDIELGEWCYVGEGTRIWSAKRIVIEDRVLISHNVNIFDSLTHPLSAAARHAQFRSISTSGHPSDIDLNEKEVHIHSDVLLGANTIVLSGVSVGQGAIVGAGSVVTHDVPPNTIVAGNPARIIRELAPDEL